MFSLIVCILCLVNYFINVCVRCNRCSQLRWEQRSIRYADYKEVLPSWCQRMWKPLCSALDVIDVISHADNKEAFATLITKDKVIDIVNGVNGVNQRRTKYAMLEIGTAELTKVADLRSNNKHQRLRSIPIAPHMLSAFLSTAVHLLCLTLSY